MSDGPVLVLGARSDIGRAVALHYGSLGRPIQIAARNAQELERDATDIEVRHGVAVTLHEFDALTTDAHAAFVNALPVLPEVAVCVVGVLGEQAESERNLAEAARVMRSNYEGPALVLAELANRFAERGTGTLVGVSSVAGDRGRGSNYVYGSAKAGFTAFLSGLRNRMARRGVHVVTVKPGFVATRMIEDKETPGFLTAEPQDVAVAIERAVRRRRNVIYVGPIWRWVMLVVRNIPEAVFKRLSM